MVLDSIALHGVEVIQIQMLNAIKHFQLFLKHIVTQALPARFRDWARPNSEMIYTALQLNYQAKYETAYNKWVQLESSIAHLEHADVRTFYNFLNFIYKNTFVEQSKRNFEYSNTSGKSVQTRVYGIL
jgi:hypothetical protein